MLDVVLGPNLLCGGAVTLVEECVEPLQMSALLCFGVVSAMSFSVYTLALGRAAVMVSYIALLRLRVITRENGWQEGLLCIVPREYEFPLLCRDLGELQSLLGSWSGACFSCVLVIFHG